MVTISLCMIVKNEEAVLARCLDTVCDLVDEIIIVDTGSTDATKMIAGHYTDKIYDFVWVDDFSAARNFAFSKATMQYIYSADADEVLDEENRERFRLLKMNLLPEIEIVQMSTVTSCSLARFTILTKNTARSFSKDYGSLLGYIPFMRRFVWTRWCMTVIL